MAATNRKIDLDQALLSRFDTIIYYPLPDLHARKAIFEMYAKQLSSEEHDKLAQNTEGASARDIKEICENAERSQTLHKHHRDGCFLPRHVIFLDYNSVCDNILFLHPTMNGFSLSNGLKSCVPVTNSI